MRMARSIRLPIKPKTQSPAPKARHNRQPSAIARSDRYPELSCQRDRARKLGQRLANRCRITRRPMFETVLGIAARFLIRPSFLLMAGGLPLLQFAFVLIQMLRVIFHLTFWPERTRLALVRPVEHDSGPHLPACFAANCP